MNLQLKVSLTAIIFSMFTVSAFAQNKSTGADRWISTKGYWVVESNIHTPLHHVVRCYTNEDVLIYTETLDGVKLNTNKRNIKMKLKKVLESSIVAWLQNKKPEANKDYVKALLK